MKISSFEFRKGVFQIHINPCFFKAANSKTLTIISKNQNNEIRDGDQFAFLPESCWYQAKIKTEAPDEPPSTAGKREHEEEISESAAKKPRRSSDLESTENSPEPALTDHKEGILANVPPVEDSAEATTTTGAIKTENVDEMECNSTTDTADAPGEKPLSQCLSDRTGTNETSELATDQISLEVKQELIEVHEEALEGETVEVEVKEEPVEEQCTAPEAPQDNTVQSIDKEERLQPIDKEKIVQPMDKEQRVQPIDKDERVQPIDKEERDQLIDKEEIVQPSTSASATSPRKREQCWYGDICYR